MMADMVILQAQCLCKTNSYSAEVPKSALPLTGSLCHCHSCRHVTGALFLQDVGIPSSPLTQKSCTSLIMYDFSVNIKIYFCSKCGCQMFSHDRRGEGETATAPDWVVLTGAIVAESLADMIDFSCHAFVEDTKDGGLSDWLPSIGGKRLPRFAQAPKKSAEIMQQWRGNRMQSSTSDRLGAHCLCKGVGFSISRPAEDQLAGSHSGPRKYHANVDTCTSCRFVSGVMVAPWVTIPVSNVHPNDGGSGFSFTFGALKIFRSSQNVTRAFCGRCGATVLWASDGQLDNEKAVDVAVGLLDSECGARAEDWLDWETDRIPFEDDLPHKPLVESLKTGVKEWGQSLK